jgi:hypothetical protein
MYPHNYNLSSYYIQQAGGGFSLYKGNTPQQGYGLFSNAFRRFGIPLLKFLGRQGINYVQKVGSDVANTNISLKEALRKNIISTGKDIALTGLQKAQERVSQVGTGRKRKRATKAKKPIKRVKKTIRKRKAPARKRKTTSKKPFNNSFGGTDLFGY